MGENPEQRIVQTSFTFREANEKIRAKADEYDAPLERIPFLCECPRPDCVEILRLTTEEYANIRSNPAHFVAAIGHEAAEGSFAQIVSEREHYVILEEVRSNDGA
jgi:hypothetical protein